MDAKAWRAAMADERAAEAAAAAEAEAETEGGEGEDALGKEWLGLAGLQGPAAARGGGGLPEFPDSPSFRRRRVQMPDEGEDSEENEDLHQGALL